MKILSYKINEVKDTITPIPDEITLENHKCAECGYFSKEIKIKFDSNPDYSRISKLHPNWDLSKGNLGYIICPKCKTRNDIFITAENTYINKKSKNCGLIF